MSKAPTKAKVAETKRQLAALRREHRIWRNAIVQDPMRIDEFIVCPVHRNAYQGHEPIRCGDPGCEGCMATAYRAGKADDLVKQAEAIKETFAREYPSYVA